MKSLSTILEEKLKMNISKEEFKIKITVHWSKFRNIRIHKNNKQK